MDRRLSIASGIFLALAAVFAAGDSKTRFSAHPDATICDSYAREGFADRAYRPDGSLVPRSEPGAVIDNAEAVTARAVHSEVRDRGGAPATKR